MNKKTAKTHEYQTGKNNKTDNKNNIFSYAIARMLLFVVRFVVRPLL